MTYLKHKNGSLEEKVLEAMDPVNKKALKKDFDDRKDKDVDNDGINGFFDSDADGDGIFESIDINNDGISDFLTIEGDSFLEALNFIF